MLDRGGWSRTCSPTSSTPASTCSPTARTTAGKTSGPARCGVRHGRRTAPTAASTTTTSPSPPRSDHRQGQHKGRVLSLRQITRRKPGRGGADRQVRILTTRPADDLPAAGVVYRMTSRWREENYPLRSRPLRPRRPRQLRRRPGRPGPAGPESGEEDRGRAVKAAKKAVAQAEAARQEKLAALRSPAPGISTVITNQMLARLERPVEPARRELGATQAAAKATPAKSRQPAQPRAGAAGDRDQADTHAIRMAACNAETTSPAPCTGLRPRRRRSLRPHPRASPPAATSSQATAPHVRLDRSPRPGAPAPSPRSATSSTPPKPATPAPRSPCATKSKNTRHCINDQGSLATERISGDLTAVSGTLGGNRQPARAHVPSVPPVPPPTPTHRAAAARCRRRSPPPTGG